LSKINDSL
ncbi:molybdate ABC transporter periplasmic molybdate-binding protein, partial [Haemophilus influenzae]